MLLRKKVFTSQKISLFFGGREFRVQALVSVYGVKYAFDEYELPEEAREYLGYEVQMMYKSISARCRIVEEANPLGTIYNLRFVNPSLLLTRQIERDIKESGLPSPWLRALPRLSTDATHLPGPSLAVLYYRGDTHFLNVKNFTVGGVLLEFVGGKLPDVASGTVFNFDLVTHAGDKIPDIAAVVSHISMELNEQDGSLSRTFFGMKFLPMEMLNQRRYRELIREHCLQLQREEQSQRDLA